MNLITVRSGDRIPDRKWLIRYRGWRVYFFRATIREDHLGEVWLVAEHDPDTFYVPLHVWIFAMVMSKLGRPLGRARLPGARARRR